MKKLFPILSLLLSVLSLTAQPGHRIGVRIDGFQRDTLFLGYYLGDKQYLRDTVTASPGGEFVFQGDESLEGGMYLVVLPPDNNFFQVLVNPGEQSFSVHTRIDDLVGAMKVQGSPDNQLFYDYLQFLNAKRPQAESLNQELQGAGGDAVKKQEVQAKLEKLNEEVKQHQEKSSQLIQKR
jgi:hypothetical protein